MLPITIIALGALIIFAISFGIYRFTNSVEKEKESMFNLTGNKERVIGMRDLEKLPPSLATYLKKVGITGKCSDCHAIFKQQGRIKTGRYKNWTNFTATQYMTADTPNFIWSARAYPLFIRDKSINGSGEVKVNILGLKDVAKFDGTKTDKSALSRCLGELLFYPIGFLSDAITWEELGDGSLKATVLVNKTKAEGIFFFNDEGLLYRFESKRYMGDSLEDFTGIAEDYQTLSGLFIPSKMKAIWNLKDGDFEYFNATIKEYKID